MVTKLKSNLSYIKYIRNKVKDSFPDWKEENDTVYEDQINNNFGISYLGNIDGYSDSLYKVLFVKDRGLLELRIYSKEGYLIDLGYLIYNGIMSNIPSQNKKWPLELSCELIDYYMDFLKLFFKRAKGD